MVVLDNVSLCSIVRDEIMNPAGGIERFVDSTVPYVEQAIIADTGSVDGTREKLEELQGKYSNLKVVDIPFEGYATTRNKALKFVKTKKALILDADELITHEKPKNDWEILREFVRNTISKVYELQIETIYPNGQVQILGMGKVSTTRLFEISNETRFNEEYGECLTTDFPALEISQVRIKHFLPSKKNIEDKFENWYSSKKRERFLSEPERVNFWKENPPSTVKGFKGWKKYNFLRDNYI